MTDMDYWCNIPTDGPGIYSQTWHRDSEDKRLVKLFLWMRDVTPETGPFYYIRGSHHYGPYGNFYPQTRLESQYPPKGAVDEKFPESERKMYTGEAGTLLLCDTSGLHKGGAPVSGKRLLFTSLFSTNAGWNYGDRFRIAGLQKDMLKPAARYATGRLIDTPSLVDNGHGIYDIEA
jgi:ectoine hydroxylase-related dioxygenase (phytanoyl-CoA dioxygenase family)